MRDLDERDAFRRNEVAFGVEPVEQIIEPLAFLADPVLGRDRQAVEKDGARFHRIAAELGDLGGFDIAAIERGVEQRQRSEERRVGKEWVSTGRSRWAPYH